MTYQLKYVAFIVITVLFSFDSAMADPDYKSLKGIADSISMKMPNGWRVAQEKIGVIPYGHYDGLKYEGPKGVSIVLIGNRDVFLHWKDKNGVTHQEALAKESIEIWIMPKEYHQSWKRHFTMKRAIVNLANPKTAGFRGR